MTRILRQFDFIHGKWLFHTFQEQTIGQKSITSVAQCPALNSYINGNHQELIQTFQIQFYQKLTPSGYCSTVTTESANRWKKNSAINDVLISIYTHMLMATLIQFQEIQTYTYSSYLNTVKINVSTHMPSGNINTVTFKINLYAQWLSEYGYNRETYPSYAQ